ncbi:serine dehydratase beta chain [Pseudalkalibacillus decolorationis]|uniref:serine dehydratase beta chain n=1 Tax=Pseudalkalibacillus decolorationis TaxID=163879 RepID=UPI00214876D0|nr:serine dehydratase beta chain [Pseudalkalibacillus decolorationis]
MGYNSCFDIIGPIMVGPSSSHTAGAVWIGRAVFELLGEAPDRVEITLYDSFAETYQGHGTDKALLGGLLGFDTEDVRIKHAYDHAEEINLIHTFILEESCPEFNHPNVAIIKAEKGNKILEVGGASVGGGLSQIFRINNIKVEFTISTNEDLKKVVKYKNA